jgi:hypothetical protein
MSMATALALQAAFSHTAAAAAAGTGAAPDVRVGLDEGGDQRAVAIGRSISLLFPKMTM